MFYPFRLFVRVHHVERIASDLRYGYIALLRPLPVLSHSQSPLIDRPLCLSIFLMPCVPLIPSAWPRWEQLLQQQIDTEHAFSTSLRYGMPERAPAHPNFASKISGQIRLLLIGLRSVPPSDRWESGPLQWLDRQEWTANELMS